MLILQALIFQFSYRLFILLFHVPQECCQSELFLDLSKSAGQADEALKD